MLNKYLFAAFALLLSGSVLAQSARVRRAPNRPSLPKSMLKAIPMPNQITGLEPVAASTPEPVVPSAEPIIFRGGELVEEEVGASQYDLPSNGTEQAQLHVWPDGNISAVWTMSPDDEATGFAGRGSGYNRRSDWLNGQYPSARLEASFRTGFSNYVVTEDGTEFISNHRNANPLTANGKFRIHSLRRTAGQSTWVEADLPTSNPNGELWTKLAVDGNTIHLLAITTPVGPTPTFTGSIHKGMNGHVLYWRSPDAGLTWDIAGGVIPGLDSTKYAELSADDYSIVARDGVVAVGIFNNYNDCKVFKSLDGGTSWPDEFTIWDFPLEKYKADKGYTIDDLGGVDPNAPSPLSVFTVDGVGSMAIDAGGLVHAWVGEMYILDSVLTDGGVNYYPGVNGILYWSEVKPDSLFEIAYSADWNGNGQLDFTANSIVAYGCALSSMPAGAVSDNGEIYVAYSAAVENLYDNDQGQNYRHIYIVRSLDYGENWEWPPVDVQYATDEDPDSTIAKLTEGVWPSCAKQFTDKFHMIYQRDYIPGSTGQITGVQGGHDSRVVYLGTSTVSAKEPKSVISLSLSPNPVQDLAQVAFNLRQKADATIEVYNLSGALVAQKTLGNLGSGPHNVPVNVSNLLDGFYFIKIQSGNETGVAKMLVKH